MNTSNYIRTAFIVVISYFLIKTFMDEKVNDMNTALISLAIGLALNYFLEMNVKSEPKHEGFGEVNEQCRNYYARSVYDPNYQPPASNSLPPNSEYKDPDIEDMKDVALVDRLKLSQIRANEDKAKAEIRKGWRDDMRYTTSHEFNTRPLGAQLYSYTMLPPENWFRAYDRPPVCIGAKSESACPMTSSNVADYMHFDTAANVSRPLQIDVNYIDKEWNQNK